MKKLSGLVFTNYSRDGFKELTKNRPIASVPFGGRYRFVDFALSNLVNSGIRTVGIVTPHYYRSLLDHVGNGKPWALSRKIGGMFILPGSMYGYDISDGKFLIRDIIGNKSFLLRDDVETLVVSATDKIFNIDYKKVQEFHESKGSSVTLIYKKVKGKISKGEYVVDVDAQGNVKNVEKLKTDIKGGNLFIDTFFIEKDLILKYVKWYSNQSYIDILEILKENLSHTKTMAYEFTGYVKPINNTTDYMEASMDLLNEKVIKELFLSDRHIKTKIQDCHPAKYLEPCDVKNSLVATGCVIKGNICDSIIFRDCHIAEGAKIKNCVIMANSKIGKNAVIENCILDKYTEIEEGETFIGIKNKPIIISNKKYYE